MELDKERSNLGRILAGLAIVAAVLPVQDGIIKLPSTIDTILILIGKEKLYEEENTPAPLALPATVERKALPAPASTPAPGPAKKPAYGGNSDFADDLDDDVPF